MGNITGSQGVAVEDAAVAFQRRNAFLNARSAGIVDGNKRLLRIERHVHDFPDFLGVHFTQGSACAGKVLRSRKDDPAVDFAEARDDAVGGNFLFIHAEQGGMMLDEKLHFLKAAFIKQPVQPFAGRELSTVVLLLHLLRAAHLLQCLNSGVEVPELAFRRRLSDIVPHSESPS